MSSPVQRPLPMSNRKVNGCNVQFNFGHNAEVASAAAKRREQLGIFGRARTDQVPSAVTSVKPATLSQESTNNLVSRTGAAA